MTTTQKIHAFLNANVSGNCPENVYVPVVNAIDDNDRKRNFTKFDSQLMNKIREIKNSKR